MIYQISVIIPIYKAEAYLHKCVDSVLAQSFENYEVLLIDDGSPDGSGKICDEYAKVDTRIRVFHKNNGGVSSARQYGIDNALGEYTIHVDPDDWVEPKMLQELYAKAKKENADMVICDFYEEYENELIYRKQEPSALDNVSVLKGLFQQLHGSVCNKLIRRVCYEKYNVKFPLDLSYGEDLYVVASLLKNKMNVSYIGKAFYHYVQNTNPNSICAHYISSSFEYDLMRARMFSHLLRDNICLRFCHQFMAYNMVHRAYWGNVFSSFQFRKRMFCYRNDILANNNIPFKYRLKLYLSCLGLYKLVYNIFNKNKQCVFPSLHQS